jgi:hypothetical protein
LQGDWRASISFSSEPAHLRVNVRDILSALAQVCGVAAKGEMEDGLVD